MNQVNHMPCKYRITNTIARDLMAIEAARQAVAMTVLHPGTAESLRRRARVRSTHFSTRIEGNRLTLAQASDVIERGLGVKGRERDVGEVLNYYSALHQVEEWTESGADVTEERIRKLHAVIHKGKRARPTKYRTGQNVIRDAATGDIVYLPPEANDVSELMRELVSWIGDAKKREIPAPIIAGVAHYQFVTIHPFYDGNGRAARALATWILYRGGYDLGKFYSLEEFYANDLEGYYRALQAHPHHNYYEGRARANITPWLEYFTRSMAQVFQKVAEEVAARAKQGEPDASPLQHLDRRARIVIGLFAASETITTAQIAAALGLSPRQCRDIVRDWIKDGWLTISNPSNKNRTYKLSAEYRRLIGGLSAEIGRKK